MSSRGRGKFHQRNPWNGSRGSLKSGSRDALDQTCDENNSKYSTYSNSDVIDRPKRPEQQYYATKSLKPTERDDSMPPPPPPKPKHSNDFRLDDFRESSFPRGQQRPHPMQNASKHTQNRSGRQSSEPRHSDYQYYNQMTDHKNDRHRETESSERYFRNGIGNPRKNGQGRFKIPANIDALPPRLQKKFLLDNGLDINLLNKATPSSSSDRQPSHSTNNQIASKLAQSPPFRTEFYHKRSRSTDVSHNDQEYTSNNFRQSNVNYSTHNNRGDGGSSDFRSSNRSLHQYETGYSQPKSSNRRDHQRPYDTMKSTKSHKPWTRSGGGGNVGSSEPQKTYERSGTGSGRQSPLDRRDSTDTLSSLPITINNYSEPIAIFHTDEPNNFVSFEIIFLRFTDL